MVYVMSVSSGVGSVKKKENACTCSYGGMVYISHVVILDNH